MNALAHRDLTQKPGPSAFQTALLHERTRYQRSRHEVADHCGVSVSKVEEWEKGTAVPNVQTFKRLVGMFRKLASSPPNYGPLPIGSIGERELAKIRTEAEQTKEPEKAPPPAEEFGAGLRRLRKANNLTTKDLADVCGLGSASAVTNWELGTNNPTQANADKLYELLPELKAAIDMGAIKKPICRAFTSGPPPRNAPPAVPLVVVKEVKETPIVTNTNEPATESLAEAYAKARAARLRKQREHDILCGKLTEASEELAKLRTAEDLALTAMDAATAAGIE